MFKPKFFAVVFAAALASATSAQAALIVSFSRIPASTGTNTSTIYDEINFTITDLTGTDVTTRGPITAGLPNGAAPGLLSLQGTFNAVGDGAVLSSVGTSSTFGVHLTNGFAGTSADSYVNLDSILSPTRTPTSSTTPTSFSGDWYTTGQGDETNPGTQLTANGSQGGSLLASIFVTHGFDVSYSGQYGTFVPGLQNVSFSSAVPEPASLGILAIGCIALLTRRLFSATMS